MENLDKWFAYQQYTDTIIDGDDHTPFVLGIQSPEQLEWMLHYSHNNILAMDSTFGTNRMKVCYYYFIIELNLIFVHSIKI